MKNRGRFFLRWEEYVDGNRITACRSPVEYSFPPISLQQVETREGQSDASRNVAVRNRWDPNETDWVENLPNRRALLGKPAVAHELTSHKMLVEGSVHFPQLASK